ncbi:MAG: SLC13 family permease [Rubricoccaceae bacterium]
MSLSPSPPRSSAAEPPAEPDRPGRSPLGRTGLWAGLVVFGAMLLTPAPEALGDPGWRVAAAGLLMAVWWMTEALPLAATALVPLVLFPLLGVAPLSDAAAPYANPVIFLFLGGFLLAAAMERWGLHRRLALAILAAVGTGPRSVLAGLMAATAFLSMWISNTAAAVMMLPIAVSIALLAGEGPRPRDASPGSYGALPEAPPLLSRALLLGIAYAASIGGMATLIGSPTNALLAGFLRESYGAELSFAGWMTVGLPVSLLGLGLAYGVLAYVRPGIRLSAFSGGDALVRAEQTALGRISRAEWYVGLVFGTVAVLWIVRPLLVPVAPGLTDEGLAIAGALVLFALPVRAASGERVRVLDWATAERIPWGVLLLFGGGLSLAAAIQATGLASWIGELATGAAAWPFWALVGLVCLVILLLTEITSNTATASAFLPVLAAVALSAGHAPLLLLAPAVIAGSGAFMLPVATPPNAIVFGSGLVPLREMARVGVVLNTLFLLLLVAFSTLALPSLVDLPGSAP